MNVISVIRKLLRLPARSPQPSGTAPRPKRRSERDIYFTAQFHGKARDVGLTEEHARLVFYEGDVVKQDGKPTNMKVMPYKGDEIGSRPPWTSCRIARNAAPDATRA